MEKTLPPLCRPVEKMYKSLASLIMRSSHLETQCPTSQSSCMIQVSHLSPFQAHQRNPLTPSSIISMVCRGDLLFEHPMLKAAVLQYQLLKQLEPPHVLLVFFFQLECSALQILQYPHLQNPFAKGFRWDPSSQLQCRARFFHCVLSGLILGLLHRLSPVYFVQKLIVVQDPIQNHSSMLLDRGLTFSL